MDPSEKSFRELIQEQSIDAEHLVFERSCHSVEEAAAAVNGSPDDFVKNLCMVDSEGNLIVAIVKGEDRASTTRVGKALSIAPPRMAKAEEIAAKTGFPAGGVPSFGFEATFLIDPRVMEKEVVYSGGGSERALIRVSPEELQRMNKGRVVRIRK